MNFEEIEDKLIKDMTNKITETLYDFVAYDFLVDLDIPEEVLHGKWDVNNPELAKWFKKLRNVDIKKFNEYIILRHDFYFEKILNFFVIVEVGHLFGLSPNDLDCYSAYGGEFRYFNPKEVYKDEEELIEINEYINDFTSDPENDWPEWFFERLFDSVIADIKTIWFFDNMMSMEEDEIKELQF